MHKLLEKRLTMEELLQIILKNITTHPDEVQISTDTQEGIIVYTITVNEEDMGRVIGKSGKVIRAIRSLAHVIGIRKNERYRVNVAEVGGEHQISSESSEAPMVSESTSEDEPEEDVIAGAIEIEPEVN